MPGMKIVRTALPAALLLLVSMAAAPAVAVGNAAAAPPAWTAIQAPGPSADGTGVHLAAVDCWAVGNCVAVGHRSSGGTHGSVIDQETDGTWSSVATIAEADLTAVSCPAAGACVAVGTTTPGGSDPEGVYEVQGAHGWTTITATGTGGRYASATGSLTGVACAAVGSCTVVGQAQSANEVSTGFVLTLAPGHDPSTAASWVAQAAPEPAADAPFEDAGLAGVACVSAGNCRAVGFAHVNANYGNPVPLVVEEKDYVWSYGGSPLPTGTAYGQLTSVSCVVGGTACVAAGNNAGNQTPFVVTIDTATDVSSAGSESLPSPFSSEQLLATSCAPDGQCQAVGVAYANSGAEYGYDGFVVGLRTGAAAGTDAVTAAATASPADANTVQHNETLVATSCVSGGVCVSVGTYVDNSGPQSQNEASVIDTRTYDSTGAVTGETDVQAPEPANDTAADDQSVLGGVRCIDSSHCTAVGSYFNDTDQARGVIDTLGDTTVTPPPAPVPTVSAVGPTAGPVAGGNTVTVTGTDLTGASLVTFGTTAATAVQVVGSTRLTVRVPRHVAGAVDVRVTTAGGTSAAVVGDHYTFAAPPTVTRVSPAAGRLAGGVVVTVTGVNLTGASVVRFGATAGTGLHVVNGARLTVRAPRHVAGTVDVRVSTPGGVSAAARADRFTYVGAPVITRVSPASGSLRGGTTVVLTGRNLVGVTAVRFGGSSSRRVTVVSSTQLRVTAPAHGRGTVYVQVVAVGGTSSNARAGRFSYR